ncbi:MAG: glycoside hydrolase family 2 TIM barrel-domain containing protein [Arachidicoccus sp.]|nr:glycoside hydrolase family 2 TIM barrel-domain containing protein [Arachidicoccus sp.]
MAGWVHDFDITRPVHYEPAQGTPQAPGYIAPGEPGYPATNDHSHRLQNPIDQPYVDVVSRMYPGLFTPALLANQNNGDNRPIFFVEYSHAMGNSNGNLKEFWDVFRSTKRIIGGCIWEFKDQGLLKTDSAGRKYYAYGGDFGEKYYDDFTIKGIVAADGSPKAAIYECKHAFQPVTCNLIDTNKVLIKIKNRHADFSLSSYDVKVDYTHGWKYYFRKSITTYSVRSRKRYLVISLLKHLLKLENGHEYLADIHFILSKDKAWANKGFEVASDQFALTGLANYFNQQKEKKSSIKSETDNNSYIIKVKDFVVKISKQNGALTSYLWKGEEQLLQPLLPHFTRPLTDNDRRGWKANIKLAPLV